MGKSTSDDYSKRKRSSPRADDEEERRKKRKSKGEEENRKSEKKNKKHKSSKHRSDEDKKLSEKRKDKDKAKSKRTRDKSLKLNIQELSKDDYFSKNNEFALWLKEERDIFFSDLSSESSRSLFKDFVKEWNKQRLESKYYEGVAAGPRTAHQWNFKK